MLEDQPDTLTQPSNESPQRDTNGLLQLVGTPIGDARYASPAMITALEQAELIAAEDTRRLIALCRRIGIHPQAELISYFDGNEAERTPQLLKRLQAGVRIALVTDAGMPSVSDPGFRLVTAAISADIQVTAVPGPSAVLTALAVSGIVPDRFAFEGFLSRKAGPRRARMAQIATDDRALIFFEAPHRLAAFLDDAVEAFGADRPGAICRELTKPYEEIIRGNLAELAAWAAGEVRGEITIVIAPAPAIEGQLDQACQAVTQMLAAGAKPSRAVATVAASHGVDRHRLYDAILTASKEH
ncbi:MAG: 16S rRNA (cytidine(1402)-2'-O)-methyltransferase [Propionibacteriaceae bacterium]|jgi:16S rRNA (cytidine1402-2'-O)-methyltransferase|nr:16S rRNA (cytidine(1402)-2'-O)-methyltransferase [Propionibacteriaceae bacterium]